jgi:hypothetical protein
VCVLSNSSNVHRKRCLDIKKECQHSLTVARIIVLYVDERSHCLSIDWGINSSPSFARVLFSHCEDTQFAVRFFSSNFYQLMKLICLLMKLICLLMKLICLLMKLICLLMKLICLFNLCAGEGEVYEFTGK